MTNEKDGQEPSMEEILSSIRRIIADEDDDAVAEEPAKAKTTPAAATDEPPAPAPERDEEEDEDVLELTNVVGGRDDDGEDDVEIEQRLEEAADDADSIADRMFDEAAEAADALGDAAHGAADAAHDVMSDAAHSAGEAIDEAGAVVARTLEADADIEREPWEEPEDEPAGTADGLASVFDDDPEPPAEPPHRLDVEDDLELSFAEPEPEPEPVAKIEDHAEELVSTAAAAASVGALSKLKRTTPVEAEHGPMTVGGGQTVEDMARELMRPMLKDWIDQNLPAMVERLVEREIKRLSDTA